MLYTANMTPLAAGHHEVSSLYTGHRYVLCCIWYTEGTGQGAI